MQRLMSVFAVTAVFLAVTSSVAAQGTTHVGQAASHFVNLEAIGTGPGTSACPDAGFADLTFVRNLPDGSSTTFVFPATQVLVVTDVDWQFSNSTLANSTQTLRVSVLNTTTEDSYRAMESTVTLNGNGDGGTSEGATTGFVVSSAATLCVDVSPGNEFIQHVVIRGYLAPNK